MSDNKTRLDTQTDTATPSSKQPVTVSKENIVDVATTRSAKDMILWLLAIVALIASTLVSQYLPRYWAQANDVWTQLGITVALVVFAIVCLALTNQGRAFKVLLKDAGIELRRVTWPTKNETIRYTWQVIVVMIIVGFIVWLLDNAFNYLLGFILH
ncbi:preprotein translocase subunit SecE [Moraxella caviae]|uniref:Protein translocase subunit SecE n=1 Tax=Moraxella caviae TaxID=34060 RepID=A0A1T0ACS0_9GAMM|nr:preprotein translocase subunit SecE [Moraxella caviae]OOR93492.1 preprotein translocase subunit SecE [Moraxella caviae]STZ10365.1 Preprotein translocase subunit SecE [Moraxella caviae]VEW12592.1 Preprotein translocase subunit SecE [Moraxella caviae]